jgi:hypothetical protein
MPLPIPVVAALATGGAGLISSIGNMFSTSSQNNAQRRWNERMYNLQRQHALEDWQRQAQYQSPEEQMRRYKEAGLNPNLIYNQTQNSPTVRTTDVKSWNPTAPQIDVNTIGDAINQYFNVQRFNNEMETSLKHRQLLDEQIKLTQNKALTELEQPDYLRTKKYTEIEKKFNLAFQTDYAQQTQDLNKKMLQYRNDLLQAQYQQAIEYTKAAKDKNIREEEKQSYSIYGMKLKNMYQEWLNETEHAKKQKIEQEIKNLIQKEESQKFDNSTKPLDKALKFIGTFKR